MTDIDRFFERRLKLGHLRLLTLFASLGQVKLVADRLHVTQPAISKQFAELEAGVGAPVLARAGNRVQLTALGEALVARAREVLLQLEHARREVDALRRGPSGKVAIGAVATVMPVLVPALALQVKRHAPNVAISFHEDTSDKLFPRLADGTLDFVFSRTRPNSRDGRDLVGRRLLDDPIVIVCGAEHPLAARRKVVPRDLAGMPWILPPEDAPTRAALDRWLKSHRLSLLPGCVQSTSLRANEALLRGHPFLALMALSLARSTSSRAGVAVLDLPRSAFLPTVWVFHRKAAASEVVAMAIECVSLLQANGGTPA